MHWDRPGEIDPEPGTPVEVCGGAPSKRSVDGAPLDAGARRRLVVPRFVGAGTCEACRSPSEAGQERPTRVASAGGPLPLPLPTPVGRYGARATGPVDRDRTPGRRSHAPTCSMLGRQVAGEPRRARCPLTLRGACERQFRIAIEGESYRAIGKPAGVRSGPRVAKRSARSSDWRRSPRWAHPLRSTSRKCWSFALPSG